MNARARSTDCTAREPCACAVPYTSLCWADTRTLSKTRGEHVRRRQGQTPTTGGEGVLQWQLASTLTGLRILLSCC